MNTSMNSERKAKYRIKLTELERLYSLAVTIPSPYGKNKNRNILIKLLSLIIFGDDSSCKRRI